MWAPVNSKFVNQTTAKYFTTMYNVSQSSRALGWDTNDYVMNDYRGCGNLSSRTWTHTGYTGTQVCGDPDRQIVTVLFTNRCYPNKTKTLPDVHRYDRILIFFFIRNLFFFLVFFSFFFRLYSFSYPKLELDKNSIMLSKMLLIITLTFCIKNFYLFIQLRANKLYFYRQLETLNSRP